MDKQTIIIILACLAVIAFAAYNIMTRNKRLRLKMLGRIRTAYGMVPTREYTEDELLRIKAYFETRKDAAGDHIDDITWNDLDLDRIFIAMNQTFSSCGEEVLYDILREPVFSDETLDKREDLIRFFTENDALREEILLDYVSIGKAKRVSVLQQIDKFKNLRLKPDAYYIFHMVTLGIAVVVTVFTPAFGILLLIGTVLYNIFTYFKDKASIEAYYVSLAALSRLVKGAEILSKHQEPELAEYTAKIRELVKPCLPLTKRMKWLGNPSTVGSSSDLAQIFLDYFRMVTHFDFIEFNRMVSGVIKNEDLLKRLYYEMGYIEAMIAVSSYRQTIPFYCKGEHTAETDVPLVIKDMYHPLIAEPIANSIDEKRCVLVTGSNASGKSTFLKVSALSAILSQTVNTVPAHAYRGSFYRVFTSMALQDNLQTSESYFVVEIRSLKRILDAAKREGAPVLCFIDEVLRGTNTVERIAASSQILKTLSESGVRCFAATHDIELTQMLEDIYSNYHFEEEIGENEVLFNFILKKGRATSRNAIRLLSIIGYDEAVVKKAEETAGRFVEEGVWTLS